KNLVPLKGKVVSGGKTLGWVDVRLYPTEAGGAMTSWAARADGGITFTSLRGQDGAQPGKYKGTGPRGKAKRGTPPPNPPQYADETTTDLTAVVPPSGGEITITLP